MSNQRNAECTKCHSINVVWDQTKAGKWVLFNTTGNQYRATYKRGPHYLTCTPYVATAPVPAKTMRETYESTIASLESLGQHDAAKIAREALANLGPAVLDQLAD